MQTTDPQRLLGDPGLPTRARSAEIHLRDRLSVFYRYRYVAVLAFLVILAAAGLRAYSQTPMYRASARLLIDLEDERSLAMEGVSTTSSTAYQDPEPYFQTQYRILTGRDLARRVIARVQGGPGATTAVTDGQIGEFTSRILVEPVRASRLVDVVIVSPDPALAASSANILAEEYVQQNLDLRRQNMERSLEWLAQELARQKTTVEASERAMAQYREDQNALSLEDRQNIVIARLNQLNDAATRARTNRAQKESLYTRLASLGPKAAAADSIPEILQNPYIQSLKAQLAELERRKALLSERYGDKHPEMLTVHASILDATRQLNTEIAKAVASIRHDYDSAMLEEETLAIALEEQKEIATDLDRKSVTYTVLQRDAESNRELYQTLLRREKELQVLANSRGNNVRLVERAAIPQAPFSPNLRRAVMLGTIVAFLVAIGLVLGLDYLDDTIKTPEDITRLGLPFLALIPAVRSGRDRPTLSGHNDFSEAIRSLRTSITLCTRQGGTIVLVTSAQPLEGKTTTACNLATALAYRRRQGAAHRRRHAPAGRASGLWPREPVRSIRAAERPGPSHAGRPAAGRARFVDHARRIDAAQSIGTAGVRPHGGAPRAGPAWSLRLGHRRYTSGPGGH